MEDTDVEAASPAPRSEQNENEAMAPRYLIPSRSMGAVEVPAVVNNVDRAIKAFGRVRSLAHVSRLILHLVLLD